MENTIIGMAETWEASYNDFENSGNTRAAISITPNKLDSFQDSNLQDTNRKIILN